MTREQVVAKMMSAFTEEEVQEAKDLRTQWLREHPLDSAVCEAGARLNRIDDAVQTLKKQDIIVEHRQAV